jgi:hypothetical protein
MVTCSSNFFRMPPCTLPPCVTLPPHVVTQCFSDSCCLLSSMQPLHCAQVWVFEASLAGLCPSVVAHDEQLTYGTCFTSLPYICVTGEWVNLS